MDKLMLLKIRIYAYVDVLLRVPPLFVIDELLRTLGPFPGIPSDNAEQEIVSGLGTDGVQNPYYFYYKLLLSSVLKLFLTSIGCLLSFGVFLLWTNNLVTVYMCLMSLGAVLVSYWSNVNCVKTVISAVEGVGADTVQWSFLEDILSLRVSHLVEPSSPACTILSNCAIQGGLAILYVNYHLGPRYSFIQKILPFCFLGPSLLAILPLPVTILQHAPVFSALIPLALLQFVLWTSTLPIIQALFTAYQYVRNILSSFGMATLVETEWNRLNVPCVLRTFWLLRVAEHATSLLISHNDSTIPVLTAAYEMSKSVLVSGCETLTAVLGMTSMVSYLCYHLGSLFSWALLIEEDDEKPIGTVSAILFYILALQTGLTSLEPDKRLVRLFRNFCLLFTALLHFVHNTVNPLLLSLSASHNPALHRHVRALAVCVFLIVFPVALLVFLWSYHNTSTWLLAVSAFSVEVIVKVLVSLMIYSLFLLDAYRSTFWEKLDDYVYYIRAFGHTVEFCFGILLFLNGAWILAFEAGGAIRAVMMCLHAYFNIWCDARAGWRVFMKRRTAVNKINSLPEANAEQLQSLDDVCAICYQEMRSAKITRCNHFFHGVCLRKWLYVQDRCPLCHDILYKVSVNDQEVY